MGGPKPGLVSRQVVGSKGATRSAICVDEPFQSNLVSMPKTRAGQRSLISENYFVPSWVVNFGNQYDKGVVFFIEDVAIVKKLMSGFNNITTNNVPVLLVEFNGKPIGTR
ncbi:hypothetical protein LIER_25581 [Lithospermum erythrorhizon]|uniref:Uncharacterized protein n=1 Tax=Lithospermum erythrorhizon TaxID=34254 RepID=A0AAV3R9C2_LITER